MLKCIISYPKTIDFKYYFGHISHTTKELKVFRQFPNKKDAYNQESYCLVESSI